MTLIDLKDYTKWLLKWFCVLYVFVVLIGKSPLSRDDTDPGSWGARSGIAPVTDAKTGCQYLHTQGGGITPRMTPGGHHMGCKP